MRHLTLVVLGISAIVLSACGSGDATDPNGLSESEVADRASEAVALEPGLYRGTVKVVSLEMPGAPPEAEKMFKEMMGGSGTTTEYCLTPEEAEQGFEKMARESAEGDCSFKRFNVADGKIDALMSCKRPDGSSAEMTLRGTGTSTSSDMTMTMATDIPGQGKGTMTLSAVNQRIGECKT